MSAKPKKKQLRSIIIGSIVGLVVGLVLFGVGTLSYEFLKLRKEMMAVSEVPDSYIQGNPKGDLIVVYFSDYECNLCREFHPVLEEAVKADGNIRLVQRPTGKDERYIRLVWAVYAAGNQGKFFELNDTIIQNWPVMSEQKLFDLAGSIGLDIQRLSRDMQSPEIQNILQQNKDYLQLWNLPRFPALIIGQKNIVMPNPNTPLTKEQLLEHFKDARSFL